MGGEYTWWARAPLYTCVNKSFNYVISVNEFLLQLETIGSFHIGNFSFLKAEFTFACICNRFMVII